MTKKSDFVLFVCIFLEQRAQIEYEAALITKLLCFRIKRIIENLCK